ncbi:MAG: OmpH family outer membrane protein [Planctomycetota bacterium]|nr:OmpH family outer membrane protein [Planctomycetota bacterium]
MRLLTLLSPLVVLALLVAWAPPAEAATKVAVVDMAKVIRDHPRHDMIEERFRKARKDAEDNAKAARGVVDKLKKELDDMLENDPNRDRIEKQYQLQRSTMKFNYEWAIQAAVRDYARGLESLYIAARTEVAAYAREQGIDLVLHQTDPTAKMNPTNPDDYELKRLLRPVIYAAPKLDITSQIVARIKAKR